MSAISSVPAQPPETGSGSISSAADEADRPSGREIDLPTASPVRLAAVARDYPNGCVVGPHCHREGQLIHATRGVMEIRSGCRLWLVPPQRAVWMPPRSVHALRARGPVSLRTLYVALDGIPSRLGDVPRGYAVTPLLRELILRAIRDSGHTVDGGRQARLAAVMLDEFGELPDDEISLVMPSDPRLGRACARILAEPGREWSVGDLALSSGASVRTLARLARDELGCSLTVWRQQARVVAAVPLLVSGVPVMQTAQELGYETPSAFSATFKRLLGTTPRAFAAERRKCE